MRRHVREQRGGQRTRARDLSMRARRPASGSLAAPLLLSTRQRDLPHRPRPPHVSFKAPCDAAKRHLFAKREALLAAFGGQESSYPFTRGFERAPFCKTRGNKKGLARAAMPRVFGFASPPNATSRSFEEVAGHCAITRKGKCEVVPGERMSGEALLAAFWEGAWSCLGCLRWGVEGRIMEEDARWCQRHAALARPFLWRLGRKMARAIS